MEKENILNEAVEGYISVEEAITIKVADAVKKFYRALNGVTMQKSGTNAQWNADCEAVISWLSNNHGKGLMITGRTGTGKTAITLALAMVLHAEGYGKVFFVPYSEMNDKVNEMKEHRMIILDDAGAESIACSYGEKHFVFPEVVDAAERTNKLLIVTTNLSVGEMAQKYGDRTIDRLKAVTKFVSMSGKESFRGKAAAGEATSIDLLADARPDLSKNTFVHQHNQINTGCTPRVIKWQRGLPEVLEWLKSSEGKGLLLVGAHRMGLTTIMKHTIPATLKWYYYQPITCWRYDAKEIGRDLIAGNADKSEMVAVDNVGEEPDATSFPDAVSEAAGEGVLMVAASHLNADELHEKYGDEAWETIAQYFKIVVLDGWYTD